jgi:hypothetical protein
MFLVTKDQYALAATKCLTFLSVLSCLLTFPIRPPNNQTQSTEKEIERKRKRNKKIQHYQKSISKKGK